MKLKSFTMVFCSIALLAGPASALSLSNGDAVTYTFKVITGEKSDDVEEFELMADESFPNICQAGCKIRLNNKVEGDFSGAEIVTIRDGKFVIAE